MNSRYSLGIYEKAMPEHVPLAEKLTGARAAGYDFMELSLDESDGRLMRLLWTADEREAFRRAACSAGIRVDTMCLSAHRKYPLGSADPAVSARGLDILYRAVELAAGLGIRIIQLAGYDVYYEPSTPDTVSRFGENLMLCVDKAAREGVVLGFETMETPFMNTVGKAMVYIQKINSPWLQIYPDIGNLTNGTDDVIADIQSGAGHIVAAHLKETGKGVFRDLLPGEGQVDFPAVISALKNAGVRKFNAELWYRTDSDWMAILSETQEFYRGLLNG